MAAIDKIIPKRLNYDGDERTVSNGDMVDAQNITLSIDGDGSFGVMKNIKGTIPGTPATPEDAVVNAELNVAVGQVSDDQRGFIYYAVYSNEGNHTIYQYNTSNDTYRIVYRNAALSFDEDCFVKMDVVNGEFQQDGELQTILYFTDNVNPPRKINVDRALASQYDAYFGDRLEYAINTIKAAPVYPPTASFADDIDIELNNIRGATLQFATQIIYKDGEESAISPYSKLAVANSSVFLGLEEYGYGFSPNTKNVCLVKLNIINDIASPSFQEAEAVRLLARTSNTGNFFVVDEFSLNEDLVRNVFGVDKTIYATGSQEYRFYNDVLGRIVPTTTVDKMYDSVPHKAEGQTVSGNRLMFSNYEEGYPNVNVSGNMTVKYGGSIDGYTSLILNENIEDAITENHSAFNFAIDVPALFGLNIDDTIPAQTTVTLSMEFSPTASSISTVIGNLFRINDVRIKGELGPFFGPGNTFSVDTEGFIIGNSLPMDEPAYPFDNASAQNLSITFVTDEETSISEITQLISNNILNTVVPVEYMVSNYSSGVALGQNSGTLSVPSAGLFMGSSEDSATDVVLGFNSGSAGSGPTSYKINYKFNTFVNPLGQIFVFPEVDSLNLDNLIGSSSSFSNRTVEVIPTLTFELFAYSDSGSFVEEDNSSDQEVTSLINTNITSTPLVWNPAADATRAFLDFGFKSGAIHKLGVVYYDKFNRSGFVNELGTVYAGWYNDPDRINDDGEVFAGPPAIEVEITSDPPEWADSYQIVYPGNGSVSDFVQYNVGSAYPARVGDLDFDTPATRNVDINSRRLYVSLETLQQYKADKSTARDYSFTKGDKLRVVSLRGPDENFTIDPSLLGELYADATDETIIEFEVVGVEVLAANEQNPIAFKKNATGDAETTIGTANDIQDEHIGTFLVLENSAISSGALGLDGNALKYRGFDWNSVVRAINTTESNIIDPDTNLEAYRYVDESSPTASVNNWRKQVVVEIYSPKLSTGNEVFYEIGESRRIGRYGPGENLHGPAFLVTSGDVNYRPVPCKGMWYGDHDDDGAPYTFNHDEPDEWRYETKNLENNFVIETNDDKSWSRGRPHVKLESAATIRRFNGITYSDAYNEDVAILTLSSFNASLVNYYSLSSKYGAARYISDYGDIGSLIAVQENKFSQTSVDKSLITDAAGQSNVALSTNVLGTTKYYNGDYGCANHPESVLVQDNDVYFFDRSRQKVLRFAGGQLFPISDKGAASLFEKETDKFNRSFSMDQGKIVSGYDPNDDQYFITFRPTSLALNYTLDESETELEDVSEGTNNSYSFAVWFRMNEAMLTAQQSYFTILSDYRYFDDPAPTIGIDTLFSTNLEVSLGDGDPQLVFVHRLGVDIPTGLTNNTTFVLTGDITTPDEWQHCCIVVDTSDQLIKMYLNGELVDSVSNDTTGFFPVEENNYNGVGGKTSPDGTFLPYLDFDQTELRVGRRVGYSNLYPFIGEIDDISFFNEALTDLEVSTISGGGVYPDSVQAFFPFIQGTVSDVISGLFGVAVGSPELGSDRNGFAGGSFFFSGDESQYVSLPPLRQIIPREEQEVEIIEVEPATIPPPSYSANQDNPYAGLTVSYDVSQSNGIWTSRHTFFPNLYSNQNNRMFSAVNVVNTFVDSTALMFHKHADNFLKNNRSTFYAQPTAESFARVVSNSSPSAVKVYDAISYEGDTAGFNVRIESSDGARTNVMNHFDKREDSYYINAGRDTTANSTSQITGIGNCIGIADLTGNIQMDSSLIGIPVMVGSVIKRYNADTQSLENIGTSPDEEVTVLDVLEDGVIQTSAVDASSAIGSPIVLITNSEIDGDSIRGHYALIKLSNTANNKYEVYCVNAHVTLSNLNHSR
tara:strand:- start:2772 stop:8345 length:5574 start_codon:yes stop_codon:yes gene_type:complete